MSKKLVWGAVGAKRFETGVSQGALYQKQADGTFAEGVAWDGLTGFTPTPKGGESTPLYADNVKYLNIKSNEDFDFGMEAYTYPDEFGQNDGTAEPVPGMTFGGQSRKDFGFSCKTLMGNDVDGVEAGYKLHLIYGASAAPSSRSYSTVNESPEAMTFSWECTTTPVPVTGHKPVAHIELDSTKIAPAKMAAIETILYGTESVDPRMPTPNELLTLLAAA